jgi:hypothetical protein
MASHAACWFEAVVTGRCVSSFVFVWLLLRLQYVGAGLSPTLQGIVPYAGMSFMFYETFKAQAKARGWFKDDHIPAAPRCVHRWTLGVEGGVGRGPVGACGGCSGGECVSWT